MKAMDVRFRIGLRAVTLVIILGTVVVVEEEEGYLAAMLVPRDLIVISKGLEDSLPASSNLHFDPLHPNRQSQRGRAN